MLSGCLAEDRAELAMEEKRSMLQAAFAAIGLDFEQPYEIYLRAFKSEKQLEIWVRGIHHDRFVLLERVDVCKASGELGPKRREGDGQVPEGFYHIDRFNPKSRYHLSLGLDYPNAADRVLADTTAPGGDIFLHGGCASVGCLAITDDKIKELYVLASQARKQGQEKIPVHIFPAELSEENMANLVANHPGLEGFWMELLPAFHYFERHQRLPEMEVGSEGRYQLVASQQEAQ